MRRWIASRLHRLATRIEHRPAVHRANSPYRVTCGALEGLTAAISEAVAEELRAIRPGPQ